MLSDRLTGRLHRAAPLAISAVAFFFFALFLFWPIAVSIRSAFLVDGRFTLSILVETLRHPVYLEGLGNALVVACASTLAALLLAAPLAILSDRYQFPGRELLGAALLLPLILPPFVGALGARQILGQAGAFNALLFQLGWMDPAVPVDWLGQHRLAGIVAMNALHLFPIIYLNLSAALAAVDPSMEEAAASLGCPPGRRLLRITFPLTAPGLFAGCTLVFIWSFTELGIPLIFDFTRITPVQIFDGLKDLAGNPFPYALVVVVLVTTVLLFSLSKIIAGPRNVVSSGRPAVARSTRLLPVLPSLACSALFILVIAVSILPHAGVLLLAFAEDWYNSVLPGKMTLAHFPEALGHPLALSSIRNSLLYASGAVLLDLILGLGIAHVIVRTQVPGRRLLDLFSMLPLAVPGLVLAFGYLAMTREGAFFDFLSPGGNPALLLVVAYGMRRLPYVVRSAVAGYEQTSPVLEEAARNLGASPLTTLRRITLPLISLHLVAGGLLAFAFAMLEVSDSLILASRYPDFPLTKAIYTLLDSLGSGPFLAAALGVWAMAFLGVTVLGARLLLGRRLGTILRG
ncbi:MAG TPA: ABC transporter permease subunit [Verrucomicrobiales bacterium]|nr:ABC transporter permease subunit [Verrucomicrobiales bacterium]